MLSSQVLIDQARTWLGVPYKHQGRTRSGVDCGGLLLAVGAELGLELVQPGTYSMSPDPKLIELSLLGNCTKVTELEPGCVLWFSFAGEPRHVGLATDIGVIHSWAKPNKVVEHRLDDQWMGRLKGIYKPNVMI